MNYKLLELHFSQLVKVWHKSKNNVFSDTSKQEYNNQLKIIFEYLKKEDFSKLSENDIELRHVTIDFFFKSIEFLDNSTANLIPYEIVECLKFALGEWIDDSDKYIIVTSLKNNVQEFSFDPTLAFGMNRYYELEKTYNATFERKLIQINLPKYLSRDYLSSVVLYHELGHFVDLKHRITDAIYNDLGQKFVDSKLSLEEINAFKEYFPFFFDSNIPVQIKFTLFQNHLREYFSDLFASQYIGKASNYYLDYITSSKKDFNLTHPSTIKRVSLVNSFIDGKKDKLVEILIDAALRITGKNIKLRYKNLVKDDFLNLLPHEILSFEEISSLFVLGWELWLNNKDDFKTINRMNFNPNSSDIYIIINNLIEKSISNYVVKTIWEKSKIDVPA